MDMEGTPHVIGAPILQVLNISIHSNNNSVEHDVELNIYGEIKVADGLNNEFLIYECPQSNPDILGLNDELHLNDTDPVVAPFPCTVFKVCLKGEAQGGCFLVDGTLVLDYSTAIASAFDQVEVKYIQGNGGWFVSVRYILHTTAVLAYIHVTPYKRAEPTKWDNVGVDCYDKSTLDFESTIAISISLESMCGEFTNYVEEVFRTSEPQELQYGSPLNLRRSMFALPAIARCVVKACLGDNEENQEYVTMRARHVGYVTRFLKFEKMVLKVHVKWADGNPYNKMKLVDTSKDLVTMEQDPTCQLIYRGPLTWCHASESLTEVFSVCFVLRYDDEACDLSGTIEVCDSLGNKYNMLESNQVRCQTRQTNFLAIDGPPKHCIAGDVISLKVNFTDGSGNELCKGFVAWDYVTNEPWFNRPICSIIHGEKCWAEIYYCIFSRGVQATVTIYISFLPSSRKLEASFCGSIVAWNNSIPFCTIYERERYKSVLFSKSDDESLRFSRGRRMPLQLMKSMVAVPKKSLLSIEVKLDARSKPNWVEQPLYIPQSHETEVDTLCGVMVFEVGRECCQRISGKDFYVDVCVDWFNVSHYGRKASTSY